MALEVSMALLACELSLHGRMRAVTVRDWAVQPRYHRTVLRLEDGGTIGLDWFRWRDCVARLPAAAPLLLVAHPITGGLPHTLSIDVLMIKFAEKY